MKNIILMGDSYKYSHYLQYPEKTEYVYSYIEARKSTIGEDFKGTLFFGLQGFLKKYLSKPITKENIDEAEKIVTVHGLPFYRQGWEYILEKYDGYLPVTIKAVREGTFVPLSNVLVSIVNTDKNCWWLTSFLETALLRAVWYPTTVATISFETKRVIKKYLEETADDLSGLPFKLHDFGARGVSSGESAEIGGASHLVNFMGTDTIESIMWLMKYYNIENMPGFSIEAMEHSTVTSWGQGFENEKKAFSNMIDKCGGEGKLYACVSDSFDIYNAVENTWGKELKDKVIEKGGTVVIRPDSGDPVEVTAKVIELLGKTFGYTVNSKGYKVLHPSVRIIQGDGVNYYSIKEILENYKKLGWSADNIAFGMGGALLQKLDRDTFSFAMKCSEITVDGISRDVYKNPVTDKTKSSKKGRLKLVRIKGVYQTVLDCGWNDYDTNEFTKVYNEGRLLVDLTLEDIRKRSEEFL